MIPYQIIMNSLYIFFEVLGVILFVFIISTWLPLGPKLRNAVQSLISPILDPIRFLLKYSIFQTRIDISPIIALIVITYFKNFFSQLY